MVRPRPLGPFICVVRSDGQLFDDSRISLTHHRGFRTFPRPHWSHGPSYCLRYHIRHQHPSEICRSTLGPEVTKELADRSLPLPPRCPFMASGSPCGSLVWYRSAHCRPYDNYVLKWFWFGGTGEASGDRGLVVFASFGSCPKAGLWHYMVH